MAKKGKLYPAFGHEITITQAAEFCTVSAASVTNALSKLGGSMETVLEYYDKRYGGVIARMENYMEYRGDKPEERAVDAPETCEANSGSAAPYALAAGRAGRGCVAHATAVDTIAGIIFGEGATLVEDTQENVESEEMLQAPAPCAMMIEELPPERPEVFGRLALLNSAIDALCTACGKLELLDGCQINLDYALISQVQQLESQLRRERMRSFEHLIDWDAIATGK